MTFRDIEQDVAHFARRVRGESVPEVITAEEALNSLRIVAAERESARRGRSVRLDEFFLKERDDEV